MGEYKQIETLEDYDKIDDEQCVKGYMSGISGEDLPSPHLYTRSFYHGYLNGLVDSGRRKIDSKQLELVYQLRSSGKLKELGLVLQSFISVQH